MKTHFEAYRERLESYNKQFLDLAEELKNKGFKVSTHNNTGLIKSIKVLDENNNGLRIQFNEVPYRFSFEYDIDSKLGRGSGYTGKEFSVDKHDFTFTMKDILGNFKPMFIDTRFSHYHKQL